MNEPNAAAQIGPLAVRGLFGGALMGLANLVPGISGGTMLLAAGVYPKFIEGIAEVSTLKFRRDSLIVLAAVLIAAVLAIVLFAGPIKDLVVNHRWLMYSAFIGLTLGGVPVVWQMVEKRTPALWAGAVGGFIAMAALALAQQSSGASGGESAGLALMFVAGVAGASAMILPGVSGGYLLLALGVYVPILSAIAACKESLTTRNFDLLIDPVTNVVLPVGVGVVIGVAVVSNVLKWLLARHREATLGALLGLLVGAVVGLWPFQQGVAPAPGDSLKGQTVAISDSGQLHLAQSGRLVEPDDYPTAYFTPSGSQIGGSLGLILAGFAVTALVARMSK